jgi:hypothetical protein
MVFEDSSIITKFNGKLEIDLKLKEKIVMECCLKGATKNAQRQ